MLYNIDLLKHTASGFHENGQKIFFRTSTLTAVLLCSYKVHFLRQNFIQRDFKTNIALIKGGMVHALVEFLLNNSKLISESILFYLLENEAYDSLLQNFITQFPVNVDIRLLNRQKLLTAAKQLYNFVKTHFTEYLSEKTFIIEKPNYILKMTPDLITDKGMFDFKTTQKPVNNIVVSYDYALQMNIYQHFLNLPVYLLFWSFNDEKTYIAKPGKFNNIEERIEKIVDDIKADRLQPNKYNCKWCFYKTICKYASV